MWQCRASRGSKEPSNCTLTGSSDPPFVMVESHFEAIAEAVGDALPVMFVIGDQQGHKLEERYGMRCVWNIVLFSHTTLTAVVVLWS